MSDIGLKPCPFCGSKAKVVKNYLGQTDEVQVDNSEALNKLDEVLKEIKGIE